MEQYEIRQLYEALESDFEWYALAHHKTASDKQAKDAGTDAFKRAKAIAHAVKLISLLRLEAQEALAAYAHSHAQRVAIGVEVGKVDL